MSRTHTVLGGALVTALCLASVASTSDTPHANAPPLCASQPAAAGGMPLALAQWAEGARLFGGLGDFHRRVSTNSSEAQAYFDQGMRFL